MRHGFFGYWEHTSAMIFLMFFVYILKKGELQQWVNILFYAPREPPMVATKGADVANPAINAIPGQGTLFPSSAAQSATPPENTSLTAALGGAAIGGVSGLLGGPLGLLSGSAVGGILGLFLPSIFRFTFPGANSPAKGAESLPQANQQNTLQPLPPLRWPNSGTTFGWRAPIIYSACGGGTVITVPLVYGRPNASMIHPA